MLRDTNKDKEYFDKFIIETSARSHKFTNTLQMLSKSDNDKIKQCELYISNFERDILFAMYSRGDSIKDLRTQFKVYLKHLAAIGCSSYYENLTLLSLIILLDENDSSIKSFLEDDKFDDSLVCILKNFIKTKKVVINNSTIKYENYEFFFDYLAGNVNYSDFTTFIENKWYSTCSDLYWFNNLKSKQDIYTGYWCWLGAAVLKMKKVKSSMIKYIPNDLL